VQPTAVWSPGRDDLQRRELPGDVSGCGGAGGFYFLLALVCCPRRSTRILFYSNCMTYPCFF
jgi:hypothetical protein